MRITVTKMNESQWLYFWIEKNVYVCGVSKPFNYNNNLHLALKEKIGNRVTIEEKGVKINLIDAERVKIKPLKKGQSIYLNKDEKRFYSCRNWQYSNQLLNEYEQSR